MRKAFVPLCFALILVPALGGCGQGDSKVNDKQPKLVSPPDPDVTGPASRGGGGGGGGGAKAPVAK